MPGQRTRLMTASSQLVMWPTCMGGKGGSHMKRPARMSGKGRCSRSSHGPRCTAVRTHEALTASGRAMRACSFISCAIVAGRWWRWGWSLMGGAAVAAAASGGSCLDVRTPSEHPQRTVIRLGRGALPSGASPSSTRTSASSGSRSADAPVMLGSLQQHSEHGARKIDG